MKMKFVCSVLLVFVSAASLWPQTPPSSTPNSSAQAASQAETSSAEAPPAKSDLDRLQAFATQAAQDVAGLHMEKWKANPAAKSAAQANAAAVQRNLTTALPGLIETARANPDDLNATFKLYRNVNALHEVFSTVTEATRVFGSKGQYEALYSELQTLGSVRRSMGESLEQLTASTDAELRQMRAELKLQQQKVAMAEAAAAEARKEVMLAQAEAPKKPTQKKKATTKKPAAGTTSTSSTSANSSMPTSSTAAPIQ